jgi:dTDP-4-amino-4,6-dideoxygalactose transaminase
VADAKIPVLDLSPEIERLWGEFEGAFKRVLKSGMFIGGSEVTSFEAEFAKYMGVKHAVAMNSGTDALVIGLRALGVGPGDEVVTTTYSFFATAEAASGLGAKPVMVDIDPKTLNIDVAKAEAAITPRTKAIIPVHLFGHAADMDPIMAVAKKHGLKVLEDVAQAFSGTYKGKKVGGIGHAGAYSFFPSKNLGCFGDGGMLTTDDDKVAEDARMLRTHGSKKKYHNEVIGYNSRLDALQAAFLRVKLPHIETASEGRRTVANRYKEMLAGVKDVTVPFEAPNVRHVYHQYTVRIAGGKRDKVKDALAAKGIETMVYYPMPMHKLPVYRGMGLSLPLAEAASAEVLSLPIWPEMPVATQERVVEAVKAALG